MKCSDLNTFFQMYHDNSTVKTQTRTGRNLVPVTGFTHVYTPNDFIIDNDEAIELLHEGNLRLFAPIRNNPICQDEKSTCKAFEQIRKPGKYN